MSDFLRVCTYNIRHGQGMDNRVVLSRIAWVLFSSGAHIFGLQEVDRYNPRSGMCNQGKYLAKQLGMKYVWGPNLKLGSFTAYGNVVITDLPILSSRHYRLPGKGEPRGLLQLKLEWQGENLNFFNTHLGLNEAERLEQVQFIAEIAFESPGPNILMGDFNETDSDQAMQLLLTSGKWINCQPKDKALFTFPADIPTEKIDYILSDPQWKIKKARVLNSLASDHRPYIVDLKRK